MSAVFSRPWLSPLPNDVMRMIALLLAPGDLRNFVVSSRAGHLAGAGILYHSVEVWMDPIDFERPYLYPDNRPSRFLLTIVNSTIPDPTLYLPSRNYAYHLVTLCYGSWSLSCDLRALPLLAEALWFTNRLRHLRLDVPTDTVPVLLDIFRRASIIITPSSMLPGFSPVHRRPLPSLESLRTSRIAIADALMQYRSLKTVVVDLSIKWEVLAKFLRVHPPWTPTHLQRLSLYIVGHHPTATGLLEGLLNTFPGLRHLVIRVNPVSAPSLVKDALRVIAELPAIGQSLDTLSINHGRHHADYGTILEEFRSAFTEAEEVSKRPVLREVVMGLSVWTRKTAFDEWSFITFDDSYLTKWPWLHNRNEGEWLRFDTIQAYRNLMF